MSKIIIFILISYLISTFNAFSQITSLDTTWLTGTRMQTVSLGIIKSLVSQKDTIQYYHPIGTGMIFYSYVDSNKKQIPKAVLITAKHIISDPKNNRYLKSLQLRFSFFDNEPLNKYLGINIILEDSTNQYWRAHPDTTIDLAAMFLQFDKSELRGNKIKSMPYQSIASLNDYYEGSSVFVLGYPESIGMDYLHHAILRQGIISWISPTKPDSNIFLIDCNVFHGNSGGPVLSMPSGINRDGGIKSNGEIKFLGIVTQMRYEIIQQDFKDDSIFLKNKGMVDTLFIKRGKLNIPYPMGIGVVEPASRVRAFLNMLGTMYKFKF